MFAVKISNWKICEKVVDDEDSNFCLLSLGRAGTRIPVLDEAAPERWLDSNSRCSPSSRLVCSFLNLNRDERFNQAPAKFKAVRNKL